MDESYITGSASDFEKFKVWSETLPVCIGNPVYLWSHSELKRHFGIHEVLNPESMQRILDRCNSVIGSKDFNVRNLIAQSRVKALYTTEDPLNPLESHQALRHDSSFTVKVFLAFRSDNFVNINREGFIAWISALTEVTGKPIASLADVKNAVKIRIQFFNEWGCRLSDHSLEPIFFRRRRRTRPLESLRKP